jgi:hypothetical protein
MPAAFKTAGDVHTAAEYNLLPRGVVGYASVTSNQTPITTIADLTSLTVTWTAVAARRYRITGQTLPQSTVTNDSVGLSITTSGNTVVARQDTGDMLANVPRGLTCQVVVVPGAGSTTYKLRMERQSGTGDVTNNATSTIPSFILVEDIGAS